jgi:hypothetical protein
LAWLPPLHNAALPNPVQCLCGGVSSLCASVLLCVIPHHCSLPRCPALPVRIFPHARCHKRSDFSRSYSGAPMADGMWYGALSGNIMNNHAGPSVVTGQSSQYFDALLIRHPAPPQRHNTPEIIAPPQFSQPLPPPETPAMYGTYFGSPRPRRPSKCRFCVDAAWGVAQFGDLYPPNPDWDPALKWTNPSGSAGPS